MANQEVAVKVLHAAVGGITESDVVLADASDAIVIGFHVTLPAAVRDIAEQREVDIRQYRIIYEVTDDVKKALEGMLTPETREEIIGRAEVKQVFKIGGLGNIAGCLVTDGSIQRADTKMRVERDGAVVTDNRPVATLRRVKDDVREVGRHGVRHPRAKLRGPESRRRVGLLQVRRHQTDAGGGGA